MQEYCTCTTHTCSSRQNVMFVFNAPSNSQKRAKLSNLEASLTWHAKYMSIPNNLTEAAGQHLSKLGGLVGHINLQFSHLSRLPHPTSNKHSSIPGGSTKSSPFTCQDYNPKHHILTFDTRQSLSPASRLRAWGAYVLSRVHKIHVAPYMVL